MKNAFTFIVLVLIAAAGCEKKQLSPGANLSFSADTVFFDTVFAVSGSATKTLLVYNTGRQSIIINHIGIPGGSSSSFRLNIDGESSNDLTNIEIAGKDSLYIFIDVQINPANTDSPYSVEDSIVFTSNNQTSNVHLQAWGQDVNLYSNTTIGDETWVKGKPYLIYGNLLIDTLKTLKIESGTRVLFHRNASVTVAGRLEVSGMSGSRVLFASDRLEADYSDVPGQWKGIRFLNTSSGNSLNYTDIFGTVSGVTIGENKATGQFSSVILNGLNISHTTVNAVTSYGSDLVLRNSVLAHCGRSLLASYGGGNLRVIHTTMHSVWDYGFRQTPLLFIDEKKLPGTFPGRSLNIEIGNSVLWGDRTWEADILPAAATYTGIYVLINSLLKIDTLGTPFSEFLDIRSPVPLENPRFIDPFKYDLRPDTLSPLIGSGSLVYKPEVPEDIRGVRREDYYPPDVGAYERKPGERKLK
jgi:hypothetical protein